MDRIVIGMVHLLPLPGSPKFSNNMNEVVVRALEEAKTLEDSGFDGIIVENFNDTPYQNDNVSLGTICSMTRIVSEINNIIDVPIGINLQFNAVEAEMEIAKVCGAKFIRVEVFVENVLTPQGIVEATSSKVMRMKEEYGLGSPLVFADILSKGTKPLNNSQEKIEDIAINAQEAGADVIIVTGNATGKKTNLELVKKIKDIINIPLFIGSGVNHDNIEKSQLSSDGIIIGSAIKEEGIVYNKVSLSRAKALNLSNG